MPLRQPRIQQSLPGNGPVMVKNNLQAVSEFKITITASAQGAATNLLIFPGPTPRWLATKFGTEVPEQTETVLSSSISAGDANGYLDFCKYVEQVGMYISYIRFVSTNTAVWNGSLYIGEMPPNGIANPEEIQLLPYAATIGGGGYDKALVIGDHPISNTRNFFMYLSSMPASTTLVMTLGIAAIGNTFAAERTNN